MAVDGERQTFCFEPLITHMMFVNLKVISQVKKVLICRKINKISSSFVLSYSVNYIVLLNMCHQHQHGVTEKDVNHNKSVHIDNCN